MCCRLVSWRGLDLFFFFLFFFFNEKERGYPCHDLLSHTFLCNLIYKLLFKRTLKLYKKNILSLQCVTVNDTGPEKEKKRILLLIIYSLWQKGLKNQLVNILPITSLLFHLPFYFDYIISEYHNSLHYLTWNRFQKLHNTLVIKSFHTLNKRQSIKRNSVWSLYPKTQREIHISSIVSK